MAIRLNQFLEDLRDALPSICMDKDLIECVPDIFRNPSNLSRMRARKQAPKHFLVIPHYYYLRDDVIDWLKEKYQSNESLQKEGALCTLK